jgi:hypothetical protein
MGAVIIILMVVVMVMDLVVIMIEEVFILEGDGVVPMLLLMCRPNHFMPHQFAIQCKFVILTQMNVGLNNAVSRLNLVITH